MSHLIGAAAPVFYLGWQDLRINRMDFQVDGIFPDVQFVAPAVYESPWWPRGGGLVGDGGMDVGVLESTRWGDYDMAAGAASRFGFVGVTRDSLGTPVGLCSIKAFRTSDDALIDTTTSDANGAFLLNTPYYPDAHYLVAHKTASPDIDGVTQNNLVAT